jgi:hypothetical protein
VAVASDEQQRRKVLLIYNRLLVRFRKEQDEADRARIFSVLKSQQTSLHQAGLSIPELDNYFSGAGDENSAGVPVHQPSP